MKAFGRDVVPHIPVGVLFCPIIDTIHGGGVVALSAPVYGFGLVFGGIQSSLREMLAQFICDISN